MASKDLERHYSLRIPIQKETEHSKYEIENLQVSSMKGLSAY